MVNIPYLFEQPQIQLTLFGKIQKYQDLLVDAENILLALNALNYAGMWRTGVFALNEKISKYLELEENQKVIGYLYVGTASGKQKKIPEMDTSEFVTQWI